MRYDDELKTYLKSTGLHASDLVKAKGKKTPAKPPAPRVRPPPQPARTVAQTSDTSTNQHIAAQQAVANQQQQQQQQLQATFMGLPIAAGMGGSLPIGFQNMSMLPGFPQMWAAAGQQYPGQPMLASMNMASQLQLAQQAQELYSNGGAGLEPPPAHSPQASVGIDGQNTPMYR